MRGGAIGAGGGRFAAGVLVAACVAVGCSQPVPKENLAGGPRVHMPPQEKPKEVVQPGPVDADAAEEFTTTSSGLKYRIRRKGNGKKPNASQTVEVHYRGTLDNGTVFDASYARGATTTFPLSGVIPGWTEGMQLVEEGGMIELEIPPNLGYGSQGSPPAVPGNATLHFLVELVSIK